MTTPCRLISRLYFITGVLTLQRKRVLPPFGSPTTLGRTRGIAKLGKYAGQPEGWSIVQPNPSLPRRRSKSLRHVAHALNIGELCLPTPLGSDMPMDNVNAAAQKRQGMPNGWIETSMCQSLQAQLSTRGGDASAGFNHRKPYLGLASRRIRDQTLRLKVPL